MVDVDKALTRGYILLSLIPALLFIPSGIAIWYFFYVHPLLAFILGMGVSWIWWSVFSPIWKIWAFQKVKYKKDLYDLAVSGKLIWPKESLFNWTEIKTPSQKKKIDALLERIEYAQSAPKKSKRPKKKRKSKKNKKIIKDKSMLIGACVALLLTIFLSSPPKPINNTDLISIDATLSSTPVLETWKSDKWIEFKIKGYTKKFKIQGFAYDAMCDDEFLQNTSKGKEVKIYVLEEDFEELKIEKRTNNYNDAYQVEVNGREYVMLNLMNVLRKGDREFAKVGYIISIIFLIYSFFEKPKISFYIPFLAALIIAIYININNEKSIFKDFGLSNKCAKLQAK